MSQTVKLFLQDVRELLSDPAHWTKGAFGRDALGKPTGDFLNATSFCLIGACDFFLAKDSSRKAEYLAALDTLNQHLPPGTWTLDHYNDFEFISHADVLALLDKAILSLTKEACQP